jgi:tRNA threonylcarbamoyladenosine biosynthesis protein TsaE
VATLKARTSEHTFALGVALGQALREQDFVGLVGQLGAGKTLFSRGVASGALVPVDEVSSPTYAIVQSYRGRLLLHHADLYRVLTEADLFSTGYFDLLEGEGAFLVEWVDQITSAMPEDAMRIELEVESDDERALKVITTGPRSDALWARWLKFIGPQTGR